MNLSKILSNIGSVDTGWYLKPGSGSGQILARFYFNSLIDKKAAIFVFGAGKPPS